MRIASTTVTLLATLLIASAYLTACKAESESTNVVSESDTLSSSDDLAASRDSLQGKTIEQTSGSGNVDTIRVPAAQIDDAWASYDFDGDYRLEFARPDSGHGADLYRYVVPGTGSITVEGVRHHGSGIPAAATALRVVAESAPGAALRIVLDEQGNPARLELSADDLNETIELEGRLRNGTSSTWRGRESTLAYDRHLHSEQHAAPNSPVITQASWQADASPQQDSSSKIRHGVDTISVLVRPVGCDNQVLRGDSVAMATLRIRTPKGFPTESFQPHAFNEQMQEALNRAQEGISMPIDILSGDVLASVPMVYVPEYDAFQITVSVGWFDGQYASEKWFADNQCELFAEMWADLDDLSIHLLDMVCVGSAPYGVPPALAKALIDLGHLDPKKALRLTIQLELLLAAACITRDAWGNPQADDRRRKKNLLTFAELCSIYKYFNTGMLLNHLRPLFSGERVPETHTLDVFIQLADDCRTGGLRSARVGPFDVTREHVIASSAEGERLTRSLRTPVLIAEACLDPYEDPLLEGSFACIPSESVSSNQHRTPSRHDSVPYEPKTWSYSNSWIENDEFDHSVTGTITPLLQGQDGQGVDYQLQHTATQRANLPGHPQRGGFLDVPVDPKPTQDPERVTREIRSTFHHQTTDWITIYPGQSLHVDFGIQIPNATGSAHVSHNAYLEISWIEHASISSRRDKVFRLDAIASLSGESFGDRMQWRWQMGGDRQPPPGEGGAAEYDQRKFVELSYDDILVAFGIQDRREQLQKDFRAKLESVNMQMESRDQASAVLRLLNRSLSPSNPMPRQFEKLLQSSNLDPYLDHLRAQLLSEPAMQDCIRLRVIQGVNTTARVQVNRPRNDEPVNTSIQGRALFKAKIDAR